LKVIEAIETVQVVEAVQIKKAGMMEDRNKRRQNTGRQKTA
jgi:hypothetical protein